MQLTVSVSTVGSRLVVALDGIADLGSVPKLQAELRREIVRSPGETILVDVDGLIALDDVALGALLGAAATAREHGGDLEVVAGSERWRHRFSATRFDQAVTIRASIADNEFGPAASPDSSRRERDRDDTG